MSNNYCHFFFLFLCFYAYNSPAQQEKFQTPSIIKIGTDPYGIFNSSYLLTLEYENKFPNSKKVYQCFSLDYRSYLFFAKSNGTTIIGTPTNLYQIRYIIKLYPILTKGKDFQGIFVGIFPNFEYYDYKLYEVYGIGLNSLLGYQYNLGNKFSLMVEYALGYVINLSENNHPYDQSDSGFFTGIFSLKFGFFINYRNK